MTPEECRALVEDIAELQRGYARRREAAETAARKPAALAKARPVAKPTPRRPALRRPAAPAKAPVPADWLAQIRAGQQAVETDIFRQRLRDASAQVARGEVSAIQAAKLDIANHRAAQMGIWR